MTNGYGTPGGFGPPPGGLPPMGAGGAGASEAVNVPAILLMIVGGLGVLFSLWGLVAPQQDMSAYLDDPNLPEQFRPLLEGLASGGAKLFNLLPLAISALTVFGALKMRQLESRGLAVTAAILAMIPCLQPCCCIGLPIGIWALIVLNKPEVKAAFRS